MFEHLFTPLRLGAKTAPNRIVFAAHQTNFAKDNLFSERHLHYYVARAHGGAGLIVLEASSVHRSDFPYERALFGFDERIVSAYRRLAIALHAHDALVFAELTHTGQEGARGLSRREIWAPSAIPNVATLEVPKVMELEDIRDVVHGFALTASYAAAAGLDGVELNAADKSLIRQFLSPLTNQRDDAYGGPLENRLRFAREIIAAVRESLGPDLVLGLRLCGDEFAPWAGLTPEAAREIAVALASNQVDYVALSAGGIYSGYMARASMHVPEGYAVPLASAVRALISQPVLATERIGLPTFAEEILSTGQADAVEMTRALIADAALPKKVRAGQMYRIRPCVACNQDCVVDSPMNPALSCASNPSAGRETELGDETIVTTARAKRVMIVGAGPAGLETARIALMRGHIVDIYEKRASVGGQVNVAALGPGRGALARMIDYLARQVRDAGARIHLGEEVTMERVLADGADAVVIATGAQARGPSFPVSAEARVVDDVQVLLGLVEIGLRVVVVDQTGLARSASVAEYLVDRGHDVTIVTHDAFAASQLVLTQDLTLWYQRALSKGVKFLTEMQVRGVAGRTVLMTNRYTEEQQTLEDVAGVVLSIYPLPDQSLFLMLKELGLAVLRVGDCVAPRDIGCAMLEGNLMGRSL